MPAHLLFVVGSLRKESLNRQLAQTAERLVGDRATVTYLDYADVPLMNQDLEFPAPEAVAHVREAVAKADAVWLFSPEYNHSYPGAIKNLIDWLSRPADPQHPEAPTVIDQKPITFATAAGSSAGAFVFTQLASLTSLVGFTLLSAPVTMVRLGRQNFTTNVLTLTTDEHACLSKQVDRVLSALA